VAERGSGADLRKAGIARFVRWHQNRDGDWYPEILHGRCLDTTEKGWSIDVDGTVHFLPADIWMVYREDSSSTGRGNART
jgi:hypothetical protein